MDWLQAPIAPADQNAADAARARFDSLAKPVGSLGRMEETLIRIAALTGDAMYRIDKRALAVFCADNGIAAQGVSRAGSDVTLIMARGLIEDGASVCHMAKAARVDLYPLDVGMACDVPGIRQSKTCMGTADFSQGPAMTREQAEAAIRAGGDLIEELHGKGYKIIATGEIGIGNTTTSSAAAAVLLGRKAREVTGRGAGLDDIGVRRKAEIIERALMLNKPDANDAMDVLIKVGGLDIAAMVGAYLAGAALRIPIVIDGLISCVAALLAARLRPESVAAMVPGHLSAEPAAGWVLAELGLSPMVNADMRLGEGTGAVCAITLLDMAYVVYHGMRTFDEMNITSYPVEGKG